MATVTLPLKEVDYKKINLTRGEVLVFRRPKNMPDSTWTEYLTQIAEDVANDVGIPTTIFGIDRNMNEIAALSEEQMAHFGWVPKAKVFATVDETWEMIQNRYDDMFERHQTKMEEEAAREEEE